LKNVVRAEEEAHSTASAAASGASPQDLAASDEKRLSSVPEDTDALKAMANAEVKSKDFSATIRSYRKVLESSPQDSETKLDLARVLSWDRQSDAPIQLYAQILKDTPDEGGSLEGLAHVYAWSNRLPDAIQTYHRSGFEIRDSQRESCKAAGVPDSGFLVWHE
jgi:tetratricopeptide (TPR) repeat protein